MIQTQYKKERNEEIKQEEAQQLFREFTGRQVEAKKNEYLENHENLSLEELLQIEEKLNMTEKTLNNFEESMEGFCGLINKEMTDITKKLETLKNRLLDQEK